MSHPAELSLSSYGRFEEIGRYSRLRKVGPFLYVAGTTAVEPSGKLHYPGDTYRQARYILRRIADLLEEAGSSVDEIVCTRAYLTDIDGAGDFARAHGEMLADARPVTTAVGVRLPVPGMMVEIEAEALVRSAM